MGKDSGNTSIYIKNKNLYLKRLNTIKEKWYTLYQEYLSNSDVLEKSLELFLSKLEKEGIETASDSTRKISDKYGRIGE